MAQIPQPTNIQLGNSVSATDIIFVYESLTGGTYDINVSEIRANEIAIIPTTTITGYTGSRLYLEPLDAGVFAVDPINYTNAHINTVMESVGLSAAASADGRIYMMRWLLGSTPQPVYSNYLLTTCMQYNALEYKWFFVSNFLSSWLQSEGAVS